MAARKWFEVTDLHLAIDQRVEELGLTDNKAAAAREIGVSRQVYDGWLSGRMPKLQGEDNCQRELARFLGVTPLRVLELAGYDLSDEVPVGSAHLGGYLAEVAA